MSQFGGLMKEYPQVALDRFMGPGVLRARAYFLSHFHADHMVGLDSKQFIERLQCSRHVKLYASEVTCAFLAAAPKYKFLEPYLKSLPIEQPINITIPDNVSNKDEKLLVTMFPAGHCPGSVMFLFEGDNGNVLYTGDFRLAKGEAARMTLLHSGNSLTELFTRECRDANLAWIGDVSKSSVRLDNNLPQYKRVKDIQSLYIDTTFCVPEAMYIPSREQSCDMLMEVVESHVHKSPGHMVRLTCKAKYGYEYLYVELSKQFNMKVHVPRRLMVQYEKVPELAKYLTSDGSSTQIHACRYMDCAMEKASDVLVVLPSTMYFTNPSNAQPSTILRKKNNFYRLCFSFHSSFSEIRDFVEHIHPVNIYPNVVPYHSTEQDVINRLQDLTRGGGGSAGTDSPQYKPLGQLKKLNRLHRKRRRVAYDEDDMADLFDDSPKKNGRDSSKGEVGDFQLHQRKDEGQDRDESEDDTENERDTHSECSSVSSGAAEFYPEDDLEYDLKMASQESTKTKSPHDNDIVLPISSQRTNDAVKQNGDDKLQEDDSDDDIPSSYGSGDANSWLKYLPNSCKDGTDSQNKIEVIQIEDDTDSQNKMKDVEIEDDKLEKESDNDEPDSQETTLCSQKSEEFLPLFSLNSSKNDSEETTLPENFAQSSPTKLVDDVDEQDSQETRCSQISNVSSGFSVPCTPEANSIDKEAVAELQEQLAEGETVTLESSQSQLF